MSALALALAAPVAVPLVLLAAIAVVSVILVIAVPIAVVALPALLTRRSRTLLARRGRPFPMSTILGRRTLSISAPPRAAVGRRLPAVAVSPVLRRAALSPLPPAPILGWGLPVAAVPPSTV